MSGKINIYTDGSSLGNPGPGGYGIIVEWEGKQYVKEFSDGFHHYQNEQTVLKVRELDKSHVQIQMTSTLVDQKLQTAINDMYSEEGIEYQKRLLLRSIDI